MEPRRRAGHWWPRGATLRAGGGLEWLILVLAFVLILAAILALTIATTPLASVPPF